MQNKMSRILAGICVMLTIPCMAFAETDTDDAVRMEAARKSMREMTVGAYGMTPISAAFVEEGTYEVSVESSSKFFNVTHAELTVKDGKMNLDFAIGSKSYLYVYPGTAKEAKKADSYIEGMQESDSTTFSIEIDALNAPFECASYSKRKKKWYSRKLLVDAASLPAGVIKCELPDYEMIEKAMEAYSGQESSAPVQTAVSDTVVEPTEIDLEDGEYSIEVNMTGGSGRASVSSPTRLIVEDGKAYAQLTWSSSYYDYMLIGDQRYENQNTEGGSSRFEIPITALDAPISVIADTTAMGDPVEISYTLIFYEDTVGDVSLIPQVAAKKVLIISGVLIVIGAVLNYLLKKKHE